MTGATAAPAKTKMAGQSFIKVQLFILDHCGVKGCGMMDEMRVKNDKMIPLLMNDTWRVKLFETRVATIVPNLLSI